MKKIILFSLFSIFIFSSCEDYIGDTNEQQSNRPYNDALPPDAALAGAINNYQNYQAITLADFGNKLAYVWALNSGFTTNDAAYSYNFTSNDYSACFNSGYIFADNFQDILDKKSAYPDYEYHYGIAKVFKVMCMDYITALYGDAPYSQAFNTNIEYPKYDDDKSIIPKLFLELDEAKAYLTTANPKVVPLGSEDIVFKGDVASWLKFVNTIELKLLLRLSKTTDPALVALRNSRATSINATQDFIDFDVTVNPGYNLSAVGQRSPLYRVYGVNDDFSAWTSANRANATGDYFHRLITGSLPTSPTLSANGSTVADPRRARMTSSTVIGMGAIQGVFPTSAKARFASFYFGRTGFAGDNFDNNGAIRDSYLMLASESFFLQAEAIERGYILGNSQNAFNLGISASFDLLSRGWGTMTGLLAPVSPNATTYIATVNTRNGLGWAGSTDKINCIITQKYIALAQWNGIELYLDNQRTGYPVLPLPANATQTKRPNRLIYPSSEYSSNSANVPAISNSDLFSVNSKTPYYLQ